MKKKAVIFDLDGVIVSTDEYHFMAWKRMADEEGISFTKPDNEALRGVSRSESLDIILSKSERLYHESERNQLMDRKNQYYRQFLESLTAKDILPGVDRLLRELSHAGALIAVGSSSKNTPIILRNIGYARRFDAVADGNDIQNSKPDPEVFLLAAHRLGLNPSECVVIEDAVAGLQAARNAGMTAFGVGSAASSDLADRAAPDLTEVTAELLLSL